MGNNLGVDQRGQNLKLVAPLLWPSKRNITRTKYVRRLTNLVWMDSRECPLNDDHSGTAVSVDLAELQPTTFSYTGRITPPVFFLLYARSAWSGFYTLP